MWLIKADTDPAEMRVAVRYNNEDMWKIFNDPAIVLGNLQSLIKANLGSKPMTLSPELQEESRALQSEVRDVLIPMIEQLRERSTSKELVSIGG